MINQFVLILQAFTKHCKTPPLNSAPTIIDIERSMTNSVDFIEKCHDDYIRNSRINTDQNARSVYRLRQINSRSSTRRNITPHALRRNSDRVHRRPSSLCGYFLSPAKRCQ
ncbi:MULTISPECIES: hypothetical protein [unclassified Caballeronia]|uniref:hypothetical protein n=1 Tax=unclassified Caballeronia TaxID=2646786 RepID=UPI0013EA6E26|nr:MULTISPECIES: hypothetical protein [unclassified Caballeronia]